STTFATLVFFLTIRPPPISTLFPYTTLFRSVFHRKRSPPVYSNYRSHFGTTNLIFLRNTRATKCGWKLCPNSEKLRQNLMVSCERILFTFKRHMICSSLLFCRSAKNCLCYRIIGSELASKNWSPIFNGFPYYLNCLSHTVFLRMF